jgi:5-carboxymethyl-2-hydroxymuconate isomerase
MKNFCVVIGSHQGIKERASIRCMYLLFTDSCQNQFVIIRFSIIESGRDAKKEREGACPENQ